MATADPGAFGRLLRRHRLRTGLTQRVLADLSTVSIRAIRDLEQGKARRPRQDTVRLIADGLRLSRQARRDLELAADERRSALALVAHDVRVAAPPPALRATVGREAEVELLATMLATAGGRLVEVVGIGGVGKTCLAGEVAWRLHGQGMPVLWTGVSAVPPPGGERLDQLLWAAVAELVEPAGPPADPGPPPVLADLVELVGDRDTLLVLDGVDAGGLRPDRVAPLLRGCPGLRMLLTARCPSRLPGGRTVVLGPLPAPDPGYPPAPVDGPAVRLFLDAARRSRPGWLLSAAELPVVAEICWLLDGLPVALEAAASWLAVYDLDLLLTVLRGDPAGMFDHLAATDGDGAVRERLDSCLRALPEAERGVLGRLCELDREISLDDVVALTGRSQLDCGRLVRRLLMAGVLRSRPDQSRFQVLNLVRDLCRATAAAVGR
ncbi:MAG TPA: helix-turn-helix domain-containing protein [Mycobacteriales bacterium]|nr:helix-turn-helix domain-containing protein [Mycobacteriales bacterium]